MRDTILVAVATTYGDRRIRCNTRRKKSATMPNAPPFAESVARARGAAGLTQAEAVTALEAAGIPVGRRTLAGWESGENEPEPVKARAVIDALHALAYPPPALPDAVERCDAGLPIARAGGARVSEPQAAPLAEVGRAPYLVIRGAQGYRLLVSLVFEATAPVEMPIDAEVQRPPA
jgi:transcriptional regulator with XRE-family HTH domain